MESKIREREREKQTVPFDWSGKDDKGPPRGDDGLAERRGWGGADDGDRAALVHGEDPADHDQLQSAAVQHRQRPGAERSDHQPGSECLSLIP